MKRPLIRPLIRQGGMALAVIVCMGLAATPAYAEYPSADDPADTPSAAVMAVDALLVRPLGLVSTVAGIGVFVVSLPFTLLGGNVEEAAHVLVAEPGAFTFSRPLGEFD